MQKQKPIDLGFHDDELLGLNINFEKMEAILKIKTFKWSENKNPPKHLRDEAKGNKCYSAQQDKFIELRFKLKETDPFFTCEMSTKIPQSILRTYLDGENFSMTLVLSEIGFKVSSYEIVEVDE